MKLTLLFLLVATGLFAQSDTLRVQTSAICETCKKTLEHDISFEKGIRNVNLDLDTKILTVIYNPEKTTAEKIRLAVTKTGYDADTLKADPKAYRRLPECCKKESKESQH